MSPFRRRPRTPKLRAAALNADPLAQAVRAACRQAAEVGDIEVKRGIAIDPDRDLDGFCSVMAEVYFYAGGGREAGMRLMQITHHGNSHWWVTDIEERVIDLTAEAGERIVPYEEGRGQGLMNGRLSGRALQVCRRLDPR